MPSGTRTASPCRSPQTTLRYLPPALNLMLTLALAPSSPTRRTSSAWCCCSLTRAVPAGAVLAGALHACSPHARHGQRQILPLCELQSGFTAWSLQGPPCCTHPGRRQLHAGWTCRLKQSPPASCTHRQPAQDCMRLHGHGQLCAGQRLAFVQGACSGPDGLHMPRACLRKACISLLRTSPDACRLHTGSPGSKRRRVRGHGSPAALPVGHRCGG